MILEPPKIKSDIVFTVSPSISHEVMGKQHQTLFFWAPKSLQMVTAAMKLKTLAPWKKSYNQPRQLIEKQGHYFTKKGMCSQSYGFSSSHARM